MLPNPTNPNDLIQLPQRYQTTTDGRRFLLWDSLEAQIEDNSEETQPPRMLLFATDECLALLKANVNWLFDGTFKSSPNAFYQVFTLHCLHANGAVPCVYALLPDKTQETYTTFFEVVNQKAEHPRPETVMCDYELAAMNAVRTVFPDVQVTGCFFHLKQSIYRQAVDGGLRQQYVTDENIRAHIKMLGSLAFVPPSDVVNSFEEIMEDGDFPEEVTDLYDYFEKTYIGRRMRRGRRAPRFPIATWNQHSRVDGNLPRTNNLLEGWHSGIQNSLLGKNPTVWRFLDFLQKEESLQRSIIASIAAGNDSRRERKEDVSRTKRIKTLTERYNEMNRTDFLRGISYNFNIGI